MANAYLGFSAARGWSVLDEATFERSKTLPGVWSFRTMQFGKYWHKGDELHVVCHGVDRALVDDLGVRARRWACDEGVVQRDGAGVLRVDAQAVAARLAGQAAPVAAAVSPTPAAADADLAFKPDLSRNPSPVDFPRFGGGKHWAAIDTVTGLLADHCERLAVGGSVRRGATDPKDVELVVIPKPTLWPTLDMLVAEGVVRKADYGGKPRWGQLYRGIDAGGIKVEIFTATRETWGYIFWLRTGPGAAGQYVVSRLWDSPVRAQDGAIWYAPDWEMVKKADKVTWVSQNRQQVRVADERDFFALLNMPYVEPSDRTEKLYRAALGAKGRTWGDPLPLLMSATDSAAAGPVDLFTVAAEKLQPAPKIFDVQATINEEWAMNVAPGLSLSVADLLGESVAVLGIKGSGKTQTAAVIAEELLAAGVPTAIVDIAGEYYGLRELYPVLIAGAAVSPTVDVEVKAGAAGALAEYSLREGQSLIFDVSEYDLDERMAAVGAFFKRLWSVAGELRKPYVILLEEAHNYIPQSAGTPIKNTLIQIATEGRKRGLSIVMVSQRPARIDKNVLAQAGIKFLHRATLPNDLANYTANVPSVIMSPAEVKAAVYDFSAGEALALVGKTVKRVQVRKRHTYHGGYTPGLDAIQRPMALAVDDHSEKIAALRALLAQPVDEDGGELAALRSRVQALTGLLAARDARIAQLEDQLQVVRARLTDGIDDKDQVAVVESLLAPVNVLDDVIALRADKAEARAVRKQERDAAKLVGRVRAAVGRGWQRDMLALLAKHKRMTKAQIVGALSISPATFYTPSELLNTGLIRRAGRGDDAVYTFVAEERLKTQYPAVDAGTLLGQMLA